LKARDFPDRNTLWEIIFKIVDGRPNEANWHNFPSEDIPGLVELLVHVIGKGERGD